MRVLLDNSHPFVQLWSQNAFFHLGDAHERIVAIVIITQCVVDCYELAEMITALAGICEFFSVYRAMSSLFEWLPRTIWHFLVVVENALRCLANSVNVPN